MTQQPLNVVPTLHLGLRLEVARRHADLTQRELADRLGMSPRSVQSYENNVREPKRGNLIAWSMVTGVSLEWLEHGVVPTGPETPTALGEDAEGRGLRARRDSNPKPSDLVSLLVARRAS